MTIHDIKSLTLETNPYYFSRKTMKFFGQKMRDFRVAKMEDGSYRISAPIRMDGRVIGESVRFFNPQNNELEFD